MLHTRINTVFIEIMYKKPSIYSCHIKKFQNNLVLMQT